MATRKPPPAAWSRFVDFPGDIEVHNEDGSIQSQASGERPEDEMRAQGWDESRIAHALGGRPDKPKPRIRPRRVPKR